MLNLLRVNLYRMRKDILLYVCLAVTVVMVLSSAAVFQMLEVLTGVDSEMLGIASGKTMMLNALSPMNNMGMLIPILLILMQSRDYTNGTIRNKIICGYSRTSIFMASWMSALIFGAVMLLINMLGSLGIGCLIFGFGEPFDGKAVRELFVSIFLGVLVYEVFISIAHLFMHIMKMYGCVMYFVVSFIFLGISGIGEVAQDNKPIALLLDCNPLAQMECLINNNWQDKIGVMVGSSLFYFVVLSAMGIFYMKKKDLK